MNARGLLKKLDQNFKTKKTTAFSHRFFFFVWGRLFKGFHKIVPAYNLTTKSANSITHGSVINVNSEETPTACAAYPGTIS